VSLAGMTPYPDQKWMEQQARNVTMEGGDPSVLNRARTLLLLLLLLSVDLARPATRLNTVDSLKSKTDVDNKSHTNAHRPLASHSPTGATIPPSPPQQESSVNMRLFAPCYYFFRWLLYLHLSFLESQTETVRDLSCGMRRRVFWHSQLL
jgi:hypothetical protein